MGGVLSRVDPGLLLPGELLAILTLFGGVFIAGGRLKQTSVS